MSNVEPNFKSLEKTISFLPSTQFAPIRSSLYVSFQIGGLLEGLDVCPLLAHDTLRSFSGLHFIRSQGQRLTEPVRP